MQIHELNDFNGEKNAAFLVVDDGSDTGKLPYSEIEEQIDSLTAALNERIDNIIAGGDAPSEAEIIDARLGAALLGNNHYPSLGGAIRGQVTNLAKEINAFGEMKPTGKNILDTSRSERGYLSNGAIIPNTASTYWETTPFIDVSEITNVYATAKQISSGNRVNYILYFLSAYDENKNFIADVSTGTSQYAVASGVKYIRFCYNYNLYTDIMLESGTTTNFVYEPYEYATHLHNAPYAPESVSAVNDFLKVVTGTNRLNPAEIEDGFLSNGSIHPNTASTHYSTTGFIPVSGETLLYFSVRESGQTNRIQAPFFFLSTYDEDKQFIEKLADTISQNPYTLSSPVAYVRFSFKNDLGYVDLALECKSIRSRTFRPFETIDVLSTYMGYKWAAVGDSLTEYNQRANTNYCNYIYEKLGLRVLNYGASGTGYKRDEDNNKAFYQRINNIDTTADVVTIFGSGNDLNYSAMGFSDFATALGDPTDTGTASICGCINTTIDNLIAIMPAVQLGIIAPTPWSSYPPSSPGNNMELYVNALKTICENRSIPFLDLYHKSNLRPWTAEGRAACYSNDDGGGTHPDETGHKLIASRIEAFLKSLLV